MASSASETQHFCFHHLLFVFADQLEKRRYGFESNPDSSNYVQQFERNLEKDLAKNRLTEEELLLKKQKMLESIAGPDEHRTSGLSNSFFCFVCLFST
jgi:hypothetical protein